MVYGYLYCTVMQVVFAAFTGQVSACRTFVSAAVLTLRVCCALPVQLTAVATALSGAADPTVACLLISYPTCLFFGVLYLLRLVKLHGSVVAAGSTVVRKIAAFVISYVYFQRPVTLPVLIGATFVFSAIVFKTKWSSPASDTDVVMQQVLQQQTPSATSDDDADVVLPRKSPALS